MSITIHHVNSRKDMKKFIYLPEKIHKGRKNWVPPIYMDEWTYFNAKKNNAFNFSDTVMLLAYKDSKLSGRIMGIINHRYNELRGEKTARFAYLETWEDEAVVARLLEYVENWARDKGMKRIIGPYGFSDQDPEGFIYEGFENRATIATYFNMEWMPPMVEKRGYTKDVDYVVYKVEIPKEMPPVYTKVFERMSRKGNYELLEFRKKKEIKPWIVPVLSLMNECYTESNIYGYSPLSEKEMKELAKRYLPILDPKLVKGVKKDGEILAFVIAMPDMTEGIQKARGRLFPFGILKILRAAKKTKQLDVLLGAVKPEFRGRGLDVMMGVKMLIAAWEAGFEIIDSHHELEHNLKVRAEMERLNGKIYKRFRVYQKNL
jgi:hypothetical protein